MFSFILVPIFCKIWKKKKRVNNQKVWYFKKLNVKTLILKEKNISTLLSIHFLWQEHYCDKQIETKTNFKDFFVVTKSIVSTKKNLNKKIMWLTNFLLAITKNSPPKKWQKYLLVRKNVWHKIQHTGDTESLERCG